MTATHVIERIDQALSENSIRQLVSAAEFTDVLLDIRLDLTTDDILELDPQRRHHDQRPAV